MSKSAATASSRAYFPPRIRAERRLRTHEIIEGDESAGIDATVDKYDYLIVFPNTKTIEDQLRDTKATPPHISWQEAKQIWWQCTPGDDESKQRSVNVLEQKWRERTSSKPGGTHASVVSRQGRKTSQADQPSAYDAFNDTSTLKWHRWLEVARQTIVDTLYQQSGLHLKMTADRQNLYMRIRSPVKLLELQAAREGYKLQHKGEIDPGYEFWSNEEELVEAVRPLNRDEANEVLERLYQHGKIPPSDLSCSRMKIQDNGADVCIHWNG